MYPERVDVVRTSLVCGEELPKKKFGEDMLNIKTRSRLLQGYAGIVVVGIVNGRHEE